VSAPVFVGSEVAAAGFRLCGLRTLVPRPGEELKALEQARAQGPLVLIGADCAARMPRAVLEAALSATAPLVLVVPDPQGRASVPDIAARTRAQLGMET
jgi:vacuolar-type H+-ATPase subunit F/Vma7